LGRPAQNIVPDLGQHGGSGGAAPNASPTRRAVSVVQLFQSLGQPGPGTGSANDLMKVFWIMALISLADRIAVADPSWQQALAQMPLARPAIELNHSNCVTLLLDSFQSNAVVKALVFMPGATDEIDFFRRARAHLTNSNPSLLNAITALTNQTYVQVRFETPLLILYTVEDPTNVVATIKSTSTAGKLHRQVIPRRIELRDADWGDVHDALDKDVSIGLSPRGNS